MTEMFDAGHRQLCEAECAGLSAAWRRAAETSSVKRGQEPPLPKAGKVHRWRTLLAAAAIGLVAGLGAGLELGAVRAGGPGEDERADVRSCRENPLSMKRLTVALRNPPCGPSLRLEPLAHKPALVCRTGGA